MNAAASEHRKSAADAISSMDAMRPSGQAVDADPGRPPFGRERAGERVDARLRRGSMRLTDRAEQLQRRADVEDDAATACLQVGKRGARDVEGALQVDVHHRPEAVRRQVLRERHEVPRGAVHQDVEPSERVDRPRHGLLHIVWLADVAGHGQRSHAAIGQLACRRLEVLGAAAGDGDIAAE
jgi:hypothetical protein